MRLATFIRNNEEEIVDHWESFARGLVPAAHDMSPHGLRNHIKDILAFISSDIGSAQTKSEQLSKSEGKKPKSPAHSAAEIHAALRQAGGFNMNQMVSEFRALRASVTSLWEAQLTQPVNADILDLTRFNEALDQVITESIGSYTKKIDRSRDLFLGILSHDLRNPLQAILMSAELAGRIGPLNERQTMLISQVVTSSGRATEILDHLLDLTRARLGSGLDLIRKPMDMAFVSRQLVDEMRVMHPTRTFTLEISGETKGDWDRARVGQVFSNLLGNAVRYGFTDVPVGIAITGNGGDVTVSVHNEGIPIAPNAIGGIFDSLTRGDGAAADDRPGSTSLGLGLYITKEILSAHGGEIDVTSTEEEGTTFTARLPR
jgi:signal transduction histidine kinase